MIARMDNHGHASAVAQVIDAPTRDVDGLAVRRALPTARRRMIGPFIFFDHMGPAQFEGGGGLAVRPHPHIGLATVTYLFEGEIIHRDSLGFEQPIRPGDVNWMVAGSGIVHSERSSAEQRAAGAKLHGIQSWVALPIQLEETEPSFVHHAAASIPSLTLDGGKLDVIAGSAYGQRSPAHVLSQTLYVHAQLPAQAVLPIDETHEERGIYVVDGAITCEGRTYQAGTLLVLTSGAKLSIQAVAGARVMLLGGEKLEGERHVWWNLVSSSKERIERAKDDWKHDRFAKVPGEHERFSLPER
jgi:redox-sensitive bicupin YhaK (pirin superfamily)